jgi:hypothetical protein
VDIFCSATLFRGNNDNIGGENPRAIYRVALIGRNTEKSHLDTVVYLHEEMLGDNEESKPLRAGTQLAFILSRAQKTADLGLRYLD